MISASLARKNVQGRVLVKSVVFPAIHTRPPSSFQSRGHYLSDPVALFKVRDEIKRKTRYKIFRLFNNRFAHERREKARLKSYRIKIISFRRILTLLVTYVYICTASVKRNRSFEWFSSIQASFHRVRIRIVLATLNNPYDEKLHLRHMHSIENSHGCESSRDDKVIWRATALELSEGITSHA